MQILTRTQDNSGMHTAPAMSNSSAYLTEE